MLICLNKWVEENKSNYNIITYGIHNQSDYMAYNVKETDTSVEYEIKLDEGIKNIKVPVSGEPFVYNSLCALAVAKVCNIDFDKAITGIPNSIASVFKLLDISETSCCLFVP